MRALQPRSIASASLPRLALVVLTAVLGCQNNSKYEDAKWMAKPKAFDPKGAELTFNGKNLEAFNSMSDDERAAHVQKLQGSKGSFKGQGEFRRLEEIGDTIDDRQHGRFDTWVTVPEPPFLEIQVEYHLFSEEKLLSGVADHTPIEFTGTLIDLVYEDDAKPRKLEAKIKADSISVVKD